MRRLTHLVNVDIGHGESDPRAHFMIRNIAQYVGDADLAGAEIEVFSQHAQLVRLLKLQTARPQGGQCVIGPRLARRHDAEADGERRATHPAVHVVPFANPGRECGGARFAWLPHALAIVKLY